MQEMDDLEERQLFLRRLFAHYMGTQLIGFLMVILVWAVLNRFMPDWGQAMVNIGFLLLSAFVSIPLQRGFRMFLPKWMAYGLGILVWLFFVVLIRSTLGALLNVIP